MREQTNIIYFPSIEASPNPTAPPTSPAPLKGRMPGLLLNPLLKGPVLKLLLYPPWW